MREKSRGRQEVMMKSAERKSGKAREIDKGYTKSTIWLQGVEGGREREVAAEKGSWPRGVHWTQTGIEPTHPTRQPPLSRRSAYPRTYVGRCTSRGASWLLLLSVHRGACGVPLPPPLHESPDLPQAKSQCAAGECLLSARMLAARPAGTPWTSDSCSFPRRHSGEDNIGGGDRGRDRGEGDD